MSAIWITVAGIMLGASASLLGVWLERDPKRPKRNGLLLTGMILLSCAVGIAQANANRLSSDRMADNMARILDDLDTLAKDDPKLGQYVNNQVRAQVQANPRVIEAMADRAVARGEKPSEVLAGRGLSAGDLSALGLPAAPDVVVPPLVLPVVVPPADTEDDTDGAAVDSDLPVGAVTVGGVKLGDIKVRDVAKKGVKLEDVRIGGVKLEDIKTSELEVGDLGAEDLKKLEERKKRELQKIEALRKAAESLRLEEAKKKLGIPAPTK